MAVDALDTNLLRSGKKDNSPNQLGPARAASRRKRIAKVVAYIFFFLWSLATFTAIKIPDAAVGNFLLKQLNQSTELRWQAERVKLAFFPLPHLRMEQLSLEPRLSAGGNAMQIESLRFTPNPFALLPLGGPSAFGGHFRIEAYGAELRGYASFGGNVSVRIENEGADLARLAPLLRGLELRGAVGQLFVRLLLPARRLSLADGEFRLKAGKLSFDPSALNLPLPALPVLNLGELELQASVARGQVQIQSLKLGSPGRDLELQLLSGTITLSDVALNTRYDLRIQLKPSAAIEKAVPALPMILSNMTAKKADGFYAMRLQGSLAAPGMPAKD